MREVLAGDGGSVLVAAATSPDARVLICEGLAEPTVTPSGIAVFPADAIPDLPGVERVTLLPCEKATEIGVRTWAATTGAEVVVGEVPRIDAPDGVRIVSVESLTTGAGKTALTRRVARTLARSGVPVGVARHPIADLLAWDRFDPVVVRTPPELTVPRPLAEREEIAPLVGAGIPVATGLDAERVLRMAARDVNVVVWDGGGAAEPWVTPDIRFVVVDLLRPPSSDAAERIAAADAIVLTKADSAPDGAARDIEALVREWNPNASVTLADLTIGVQPVNVLADKAVVLVEDANSLLFGGLSAGAGAVAARRFRCGVVDPRPFAVGAIARALSDHSHIGAVIPSLGRTEDEIIDLHDSVRATPGDVVLWASNADPSTVIADDPRPIVRAFGELAEVAGPPLQTILARFIPGHD